MPPTSPEAPAQDQRIQQAQNGEELQFTEDVHAEAINVVFDAPGLRYNDLEYDLHAIRCIKNEVFVLLKVYAGVWSG